ncbi:NAD-dependent epimerase/dehydratase family protein [Halanaerobium saccharolyticum]|uniref:NAD-dependent epimerase/dehydratase family protein n=1 Tax=Halanaerobium saccharolyticum TaxID=43595 RepID=UPI003FCE740D
MKKILIAGIDSYIGVNVEKWLNNYIGKYIIDSIDMRGEEWKSKDFSSYDVIFHVAGIAHVSKDPKLKDLYYEVNRDLTIKTAQKAKNDGVNQFVFMSSIIVYGNSGVMGKEKVITKETKPEPVDFYGDSKLQAEKGIMKLNCDEFKVVILRPPMIYGRSAKGNYKRLSKLAKITPLFPDVNNKRSMLYIDNLSEFIRLLIDNEESGVFHPQNKDYVNTSNMVKLISEANKSPIHLTSIFNPVLKILSSKVNIINKVFGNLVYEKEMSEYKEEYRVANFKESIFETERMED